MTKTTPLIMLSLMMGVLSPCLMARGENIALGAACAFDPAPDYTHCTDPGDAVQLTDGQYVEGYFWTQPGTVGWAGQRTVIITLDLGKDQPIRGVSFSTAAGVAGVQWPKSISLLVAGEDGLFHDVGDLAALSAGPTPPDGTYANHRFTTNALRTHGRKLALVIFGEPFVFCDEIEVLAGEPDWVADPLPGLGVADVRAHITRLLIHHGVQRRIQSDIASVRAAAAALSDPARTEIVAALDAAAQEVKNLPSEYGPEFKTIVPINPTHQRVFDALARVWREQGMTQPRVWAAGPWDPMLLCPSTPGLEPNAETPPLEVNMMRGEYRSAAFNIALPDAVEGDSIIVRLLGLPGGVHPGYIDVRTVAWTDTRTGEPVAAALLPATVTGDGYAVPALPGLVRQVWLTFHPTDLAPGHYEGRIAAAGVEIPVQFHLYPMAFPKRPTLHFGGWDYTNLPAMYETTPTNKAALVAHLQEHFVDSPWAVSTALPFGTHDATGAMTSPPDTANFEAWRQLWPDAGQYCVFAAVGDRLQSLAMGTPEFDRAVGEWGRFWAEQVKSHGLQPAQLAVLLVDEPTVSAQDKIIAAWAKALRTANAGMTVWEDPIHTNAADADPEMIALCDVLCPNRPKFLSAGAAYRDYFLKRRDAGTRLDFYSCSGPMRLYDPYTYCRLQAWDCWRFGAQASYFWAFGDGAGTSSWNEYPAARASFTPLFIDANSVTPGKHLEACREGIEDYEYLVMLKKALADGRGGAGVREKARQLLETLPGEVCRAVSDEADFTWKTAGLLTPADTARTAVLEVLAALR